MSTNDPSANGGAPPPKIPGPLRQPAASIVAGVLSWAAISLGFLGLKMLMQERPEFVGQPMRGTKVEMVQESPRIVARKVSDDVSVIKPLPPEVLKMVEALVGCVAGAALVSDTERMAREAGLTDTQAAVVQKNIDDYRNQLAADIEGMKLK